MKRILDRLMARQQRLMDTLAQEKRATAASSPAPTQERIDAEESAIAQALSALEQGELASAHRALEPFAEGAVRVRTLTILSRLASANGSFEEALGLLKRAEQLDPVDTKVWHLLAELLAVCRRHTEEVQYRRKLAFASTEVSPQAYVDWVRALLRSNSKTNRPAVMEIRLAVRKLEAAGAGDADLKVRMAEALYAFDGGLMKDARALYRAASPCPPRMRDTTARWTRMIDWCTQSGAELTRLVDEGVPACRPMIAELSDVCIFPRFQWVPILEGGNAVLKGFAMQRLQLRSEDPGTPILMNNSSVAEMRIDEDLPVISTPALLIGGVAQYYHNTVDFLASLAVAEQTGLGSELPLVVNDDLAPFQLEQLTLLGYGQDRLIRLKAGQAVRFDRLVVPSRLVQGGRWVDPMLPRWYRQRLGSKLGAKGGAPRRLYLTRRDTQRRRVVNEEALIDTLVRRGFEVVAPEKLSVRQQIELFAQASHIVAPTGAALTNMVYASEGAAILTLYNRHLMEGGGDLYFDALAAACGHRFLGIGCVPATVRSGARVIDADLEVDVAAVTAGLDDLQHQEPAPQLSA